MKFPKFNCLGLSIFLLVILLGSLLIGSNSKEGFSNSDVLSMAKYWKQYQTNHIIVQLGGKKTTIPEPTAEQIKFAELLSQDGPIAKDITSLNTINKVVSLLGGSSASSDLGSVMSSGTSDEIDTSTSKSFF